MEDIPLQPGWLKRSNSRYYNYSGGAMAYMAQADCRLAHGT